MLLLYYNKKPLEHHIVIIIETVKGKTQIVVD